MVSSPRPVGMVATVCFEMGSEGRGEKKNKLAALKKTKTKKGKTKMTSFKINPWL